MKRNLFTFTLMLVLMLSLALTGCQRTCEHDWKKANCEKPKTCRLCDETKGEPLGHTWMDANCAFPKTCEICGETDGAPIGHTWMAATCTTPKTCETCGELDGDARGHSWADATCEDPKTCSTCKQEDGEALGHIWVDATTEAPKTCETCGKTEGDPIETDDRFITANCQELFGSWTGEYIQTGKDFGVPDLDVTIVTTSTLIFHNDGTLIIVDDMGDLETYKSNIYAVQVAVMYTTFEQMYGYDQAAADAAMVAQYGMNVPEYVQATVDALTEDDLLVETEFVYYVEDGTFYMGASWSDDMLECDYTLDGDTMNVDFLGKPLVLTKTAD